MTPSKRIESMSRNGLIVSILLIALLQLSSILPVSAQTSSVTGQVVDGSGPLAGVIVQGKASNGKATGYCITDKAGHFTLNLSQETSMVTFSLMGYVRVDVRTPFGSTLDVMMKEAKVDLKASKVSASIASIRNDTIRYTASTVVQKEDKVLGDMLKRLPGIEVADNGRVTYNGVGINRLYVEGRNILDDDYHLATKNLDIKAIKAVNIYENHQPIKVLRNIVQTRSAALDIELEDSARDSWLVNATLQGGYMYDSGVPYYGKGTAMKIGGQDSYVAIADADATGHVNDGILRKEYTSQDDLADYYSLSPLLNSRLDILDLDSSLSVFNHSGSAQTKNKFSIAEDVVLGVDVRLLGDVASNALSNRTVYSRPEMELSQVIDQATEGGTVYADLSIETNRDRGYFRDEVSVMTQVNDAMSAMDGTMALDESTSVRKTDFCNAINFATVSGKGASFRGHIYSQYTRDGGEYMSSYGDLMQTYAREVWWNRATVHGSTRQYGNVKVSLTPSATIYHGTFISDLAGLIPDGLPGERANDLVITNANPEIAMGLLYQRQRFSSTMAGKLTWRLFDINNGPLHRVASFLSPSLVWLTQYRTPHLSTELTVTLADDATSCDKLGGAMMVTGYNSIHRGRDIPKTLPSATAAWELKYSNPMDGFYSGLSLDASRRSMLIADRAIVGNHVITSDSDYVSDMNSLGGVLSLSKGFFSLDGKIDALLGYSAYTAQLLQNGISYDYEGRTISVSAEWTLSPVKWLVLSSKSRFSSLAIGVSGVAKQIPNSKLMEDFEMVFRATDRISLNASVNYYLNVSGRTRAQLALVNAACVMMLQNGMNLFLRCSNILNETEYGYSTYGPLMESYTYYTIRPMNVIAGIDFSLRFRR